MVASRVRPPSLLIPLLVSLVVHAGGGVVGARWVIGADPHDSRAARLPPDPTPEDPPGVEPAPAPEPEQLRLGMDDGEATTVTWLGFKEFEEHFAEPSEVDQPALTLDPAGNAGPEGNGEILPALNAAPEPSPAAEVVPEQPERPAEPTSPQDSPREATGADDAEPIDVAPSDDEPPVPPEVAQPLLPPSAESVPSPPVEPQDSATPEPLLPIPPSDPAPVAAGGGGAGDDGKESDRESTPASILTAEWKKLGQPLAGKGLEIKTRRPRLTHYTRIMGAARDPVVRVHFRRDGRVDKVDLVHSSGNPDVDRPVIDAVFEWRATGKPLENVPRPSPPGTLAVEFRIIMGG